jgi:hypothetical protein
MEMVPQRINLFFHAHSSLVYPIFFHLTLNHSTRPQEDNDQAFFIAL